MTAPPDAATPQVRAALRASLHAESVEIGRRHYADSLRLDEIRAQLADLDDTAKDG